MLHIIPSLFLVASIFASCVTAAPIPERLFGRAVATERSSFPKGRGVASWTTRPSASDAVDLSDETLRPPKDYEGPHHTYVNAPDGRESVRAFYPKGSYKPSANPRGGFSFYSHGHSSVDLSTAKEATLSYSVLFPEGFDFVKGGKLPGFYGGNNDEVARTCSGGSRNPACFSARFMWREKGAGEMYTYLPPHDDSAFAANKKICTLPNSECNPTYGSSIARGAFTFVPGKRTTVSERIKLNDAGKANGEIELIVDGKVLLTVDGLILRNSAQGKIRGIQMQTFFGGSTADWATPKDQAVYFSDFSVAVLSHDNTAPKPTSAAATSTSTSTAKPTGTASQTPTATRSPKLPTRRWNVTARSIIANNA